MKTLELAVVVPVTGMPGTDNAVRTQVWAQVVELLQPSLGKVCGRFEPADCAWDQTIRQPFGVILGRSDPALFLHFYDMGKIRQKEAFQYHLNGMLDSCNITDRQESSTSVKIMAHPKPGHEEALVAHLFWHDGMMKGKVLPDAGLYFAENRQSCVSESLDREILGHVKDHALAMVRFYAGAQDA